MAALSQIEGVKIADRDKTLTLLKELEMLKSSVPDALLAGRFSDADALLTGPVWNRG